MTLGVTLLLAFFVWRSRMLQPVRTDDDERRAALDTGTAPRGALHSRGDTTEATVGRFVYLFDVSASVHSAQTADPYSIAVGTLRPAVEALVTLDELMPEEHLVSTIGTLSLRGEPLCSIKARRSTLFVARDSLALPKSLGTCVARLAASAPERYTDLAGALEYAALSIGGEHPALRGVVVLSDMEEDLAPGTRPAIPDLSDLCVAVYMMVTQKIAVDPTVIQNRQREWTRRLRGWHAKNVLFKTTLGFRPEELKAFFRACETRQ